MVTKSVRSSLQGSGQRARRFVFKIWTKTTKRKGQSYENLTEDANPSTSSTKESVQLDLQDIKPTDSSIIGSGVLAPSVSGFAALGIPGAQQRDTEPTKGSLTEQPRTSYFYDSMVSLKKEADETKDGVVDKPWYEDKDWQLYYGKKGKKKLRKKVVFQVNSGDKLLDKECYVELEEEPGAEKTNKKKKKKKRVTSSKAKKRAKRASVVAWKGLRVSWKYFKYGLITMTDGPGSALSAPYFMKAYAGQDPHQKKPYTVYKDYGKRRSP